MVQFLQHKAKIKCSWLLYLHKRNSRLLAGIWSVLILIANKYLHNQTIMFTDLKFFYRKSFTTNMLCKHSTTYLSKVHIYNTYDICTFHLQFWNFWVLCSGLQGKILKYSRLNKKKRIFKIQFTISTVRYQGT